MYMAAYLCGAPRVDMCIVPMEPERVLDAPELELHVVVNRWMWVLEIKSGFTG